MDENVPPKAIDFYNKINRGGLWKPTADVFNIGILCWKVFAEIDMTELNKSYYVAITKEMFLKRS